MHAIRHQGKVASETSDFHWVRPVVSPILSDCSILRSSTPLVGINWYLRFFAWRYSSREVAVGWVRPSLFHVQFDSRILSELSISLGEIHLYHLSDQCYFIVLFLFNYFHASFIKLSMGAFTYDWTIDMKNLSDWLTTNKYHEFVGN